MSGTIHTGMISHLSDVFISHHTLWALRSHERHPHTGERLAALNNELVKLARLPANSHYAQQRIAICRKAVELLSKPRGAAEADELEKLLASLCL